MLADYPEEQLVLFKEILYKKITVREAEKMARKIASDRVRKKEFLPDPEITQLEEEFQDKLGTRVHIDRKENGGQIKIDFFSNDDLRAILEMINKTGVAKDATDMLERHIASTQAVNNLEASLPLGSEASKLDVPPIDDRTGDEIKDDESKLYDISSFSV